MKAVDKDPIKYAHHHFEDEAKALEKLQKKQARCKHKMVDTPHCLKCGFTPEE